jgi:hypothetical protein
LFSKIFLAMFVFIIGSERSVLLVFLAYFQPLFARLGGLAQPAQEHLTNPASAFNLKHLTGHLNNELVLSGIHIDIPKIKNQPIACITAAECVIIMADKHTSETNCLSLKEKGKTTCANERALH